MAASTVPTEPAGPTEPAAGPLAPVAGWDVPHAAVGVTSPTALLAGYGELDRTFWLASVTKLLTSYAVLVAVEEGAVELDDAAGPPGATVRHLLAHTSGYAFDSGSAPIARPGARRIYSNQGIEVLAAHVERATGMPFADYLAEAVLQPLGMASTELAGSPAAEACSTVHDLLAFCREVLRPRLLHEQTVAQMLRVQFPGRSGVLPGHGRFDPLDWGLGFELNFSRPGHWAGTWLPPSAGGHFGATGTFCWVDRAGGLAMACLTDRPFEQWARQAWPPLCNAAVAAFRIPTKPDLNPHIITNPHVSPNPHS